MNAGFYSNISVDQSLPNLVGGTAWHAWHSVSWGVFYADASVDGSLKSGTKNDGASPPAGVRFNAASYHGAYQDNANVVPFSIKCTFIIKY